jgi:nicotinamidase/pyrazinamidase
MPRPDDAPSRRETLQLISAAAAATAFVPMPRGAQTASITPAPGDVFIVVDVQYDFLPGGALAVPKGDEVIAPINALAKRFQHVVMTQDWHTKAHVSFASRHAGKKPFEQTKLEYGDQVCGPTTAFRARAGR